MLCGVLSAEEDKWNTSGQTMAPTLLVQTENWRRLFPNRLRTRFKEFCLKLESVGVLIHQQVHTMAVCGNGWSAWWERFSAQFYVNKGWMMMDCIQCFAKWRPFWMTDQQQNSQMTLMTLSHSHPTIFFFWKVNQFFHLECSNLMISMWEGARGRCNTSQIFSGIDGFRSTCPYFKKDRSGTIRRGVWLLETLLWLWILQLPVVLGL